MIWKKNATAFLMDMPRLPVRMLLLTGTKTTTMTG